MPHRVPVFGGLGRGQLRSFYIYRVSAFNLVSVGETFFSPESSIPAAAVPTAPTVTFVTSTETTITVSWDIPTSDLTVTGFRLYVTRTQAELS